MKLTVKRKGYTKVVINTKLVKSTHEITNAIKLALELDGFTKEAIQEVFRETLDIKVEGFIYNPEK